MSDIESRLDAIRATFESLGTELAISLSDGRVWLSMITALVMGALFCLAGTWIARRVGLLSSDAPHGETLGVGLGTGLIVLAATWAAVLSEGRSSFTPVAAAFIVAVLLSRRGHRDPAKPGNSQTRSSATNDQTWPSLASIVPAAFAAAGFVVVVGLLYGATMAPSPRGGEQPIEFFDVAYYSVLGTDLARTGIESIYSPSGFEHLPALSTQTWYHWGEAWLSAALITVFGIDSIFARHYVVLPLVLLAAAALTGTFVRRLTGSSSRGAFLFGATACVVLAPVLLPWPGPFFTKWASGLMFGVTQYGLGTISALLALYILSVRERAGRSLGLSVFCGAAIASMLPGHIVIATMAMVGIASVGTLWTTHSLLVTKRLPRVSPSLRNTLAAAGLIAVATLAWALMTGHGIGASGVSETVSPFNGAWSQVIVRTCLGAGVFFAIPVAWFRMRSKSNLEASIYLGTTMIVIVGAIAWGARLGDLNMFHVFFGGIAVFGTPVAAAAVWRLWSRARGDGHFRVAAVVFVICGVQLGLGLFSSVSRLQAFGPPDYQPIPLGVLNAIQRLPLDAKIAYACRSLEEASFWDASLVSIDAHTGRSVVPMCFQAEFFTWLMTGTDSSLDVENPLFRFAPQRAIYPDSQARPSPAAVAAFLREHGIAYIYADAAHPNLLVPEAVPIVTSGHVQIFRAP